MTRPANGRSLVLCCALSATLALAAAACTSTGGGNAGTAGANANRSATTNAPATPAASPAAAANAASKAKLNLNTASSADFQAGVPGIGNRMVHEFEEYRPYRSIQQFRREMAKYVNAEQIAEYEKYVYVPIAPNEADAATLMQIPGLDEQEAQALIGARPYASNDAFLAKLAASVSEAELAVAKTYLSN